MNSRSLAATIFGFAMLSGSVAGAQENNPVQRIANYVSVAVSEYRKGIDANGKLISRDEYGEALDFLETARRDAARLPSERRAALAVFDTLVDAAAKKRPPVALDSLERRFVLALGNDAKLDLGGVSLDPDAGLTVFRANCSSCHGERGMGDGPAARGLNPPPTALGDAKLVAEASPALMFRKVTIGVAGTAMPSFDGKLSVAQRWNVIAYLTELRHRQSDIALGEGLYTQNCASCHGVNGTGDGALARSLSKLPPELGTFAWQSQKSDVELALAIRNGVAGSPMPPMIAMTPAQETAVVAYLRQLAIHTRPTVATEADSNDVSSAARESIGLLEQSLNALRGGRVSDAVERASDAYLKFETVETRSRLKNPGLVSTMEQLYVYRFKPAVERNDLRAAEDIQAAIEGNMPAVLALTKPTGSGIDAFWQSLLIILREGFEAILVIGAVVAFLLKTGHRERLRSIWIGVILALLASAVTAVILSTALRSIPASRELIEGLTLLLAVVVLFSVSYWLISKVEAAKWQQFIKEKVSKALNEGGGRALAVVAFLAVYREGAETALFYQALINEGSNVVVPIALGIIAGGAGLAVIFTLFYRFGVKIPLRQFFGVTSVLLYYMAFVFTGKGIRELQEGNIVSATFIHFPTIDALGMYPTWETLIAQMILLGLFTFAVIKTFWPRRSVALPTVEPALAPTAQQIDQLSARLAALENQVERSTK